MPPRPPRTTPRPNRSNGALRGWRDGSGGGSAAVVRQSSGCGWRPPAGRSPSTRSSRPTSAMSPSPPTVTPAQTSRALVEDRPTHGGPAAHDRAVQQHAVVHLGARLDDDVRRQHAAADGPGDDAARRQQRVLDGRPGTDARRRPVAAAGDQPPAVVARVERRVVLRAGPCAPPSTPGWCPRRASSPRSGARAPAPPRRAAAAARRRGRPGRPRRRRHPARRAGRAPARA